MTGKLSALIDGEFHDADVGPCFGGLKTDPEMRCAWNTYYLIGDARRG
jgi:negative regulator of sigma E activity